MEKEKIKVWDNGVLRELTNEEIVEFEKQNETEVPYKEVAIPYDELVNLKIRERYTESQEFAILRQKDEKPQEYAEYYKYCEECKAYVKELTSGGDDNDHEVM